MYLGSNKGNTVLRLEEELAETRLKLAELEEENDRQRFARQSRQRDENPPDRPSLHLMDTIQNWPWQNE